MRRELTHVPPERPRRLPPLNLFRCFDAAARHLSFTLAAEELFITQSAVSQQIRQLEDFLDVRLFRRLPRGLELTQEGQILAASTSAALDTIGKACSRLIDPASNALLCVNSTPSLASKWLVPRLKGFMEQQPNIRVTLLSSPDPVNFSRQDIDVAIRWGDGRWNDVHAELIVREPLFAVCSPALLADDDSSLTSAQLSGMTLLQLTNPTWSSSFDVLPIFRIPFRDTLYFSEVHLMIEAAVQGQGICFTSLLLVENELRSGRLIQICESAKSITHGYYLLCNPETMDKPKVANFRDWLMAEAALTVTSEHSWSVRNLS